MKVKFLSFLLVLACVAGFYSCEDEDIAMSSTTMTFNNPEGLEDVVIKELTVTLKEKNTGNEIVNTYTGGVFQLSVPQGLYDISAEGTISYKIEGKSIEGKVKGFSESVSIAQNTFNTSINLFLFDIQSGLVFEEIFTTGSPTPEGKYYQGDAYFKIYNNSDEVIYADGYCISESKFTSGKKYDYTPNIMNDAFAAQAVYAIPGNGKDVPVKPGEYIIISDQAINHMEKNPNSIDLSISNFEIYDGPSTSDVDNPEVPNLIKLYASSATIWRPTTQANRSYALIKLGTSRDEYVANYKYDYTYPTDVRVMSGSAYKIPNSWIIDAVNISPKSDFVWILTAPSVDMGWTYCCDESSDATRLGKSVIRKTLSETEDGRKILQDTNNSTVDFIPRSNCSLKK